MAELKVEIDPADVGFDAMRLARIDAHFARYVDDGRLHPIRPQLKQLVYQALVD